MKHKISKMTEAALLRRQVFEDTSIRGHLRRLFRFNTTCRDAWVREQAKKLPIGTKILDLGAGCAPYRDLFNHCSYFTHDFGQEPATQNQYTSLDYVSDITQVPVRDSSFDAVLCTEVLEHVPEPVMAIREISRILRPGGTVLLTAPLVSHLHQQPYHFYGGYTPFWYQKFLPRYDLDILSLTRNRGFFSLFAQEGLRFSSYLSPKALCRRPYALIAFLPLWIVTLPIFKLVLPIMAKFLDDLELEGIATVGYHIVAKKRIP